MSNIIFRTVNSTYEVNSNDKQIRKLSGKFSNERLPLETWVTYEDISPVKLESIIWIQWTPTSPDELEKTILTRTTLVTEILNPDLNL